jgi:protein O-GlcNAc transferase
MRAAFPSASLEEANHWADLKALGSTMVFDRLMIVNRQAAHFQ